MEDVMQLSAKLPFEIDAVITLNVKLHNAKNLISRSNSFVDKLHDDLEETEVRSLQELITEARTIGVYIPNVDKIQVHIENFERAKEIKALISNSKNYSFAESRSFYDNLVKQMEKPPSIVHELRNMIETCQKWIFDLKKKVETSKSENLENKILVSDMNIQIEMTADLSFNVDDDLVDIRNELTQAEAWDQKFMSLKPPIWPKEIEDLLVDTKNYACRTQNMLTAHQKYKDYMDWANLSRKYSSESDDLPNLERINEHITIGINQISEFIIIDDVKNPLQAKLDEAITWHNTAIQAIDTKASPLVISQLINQAKSLICKFPELDILEKRANIHNKILDTLNTKHKEHDLTLLLQEAYEFDADQDLIQAVKSKQTAITELKAKIWVGLAQENNTDTFIDLLEDLKNLKTDLNDEKLHLEDKIRSIN